MCRNSDGDKERVVGFNTGLERVRFVKSEGVALFQILGANVRKLSFVII